VFQPERQEFDDWMNRRLLAEMGIRYWKFVSNGPIPRDSQAMAELISSMTEAGVLTPEEARQFAVDVFNVQLKRIDAAWAKQPLALTLKEASMPAAPPAATPAAPAEAPPAEKRGQTLADEARRLISLRDALREEEKRAAVEAFKERSTR
jgi:capsid portal protein